MNREMHPLAIILFEGKDCPANGFQCAGRKISMQFNEVISLIIPDQETVLRRFAGNASLLERFVRKFPQDQSFEKLTAAMEAGDYPAIETAAHTLKGVSGNLGFQKLFETSEEMVVAVRSQNYDHLQPLYDSIKEDYTQLMANLSLLD